MSLEKFKELHVAGKPLMIANVWDVVSTKAAEKAGLKVVGTSSHPIADTLGYKDGEEIPFDEVFYIIERIVKSTDLLVSSDIEAGYSDNPEEVANNVSRLVSIGVVGINLEDGLTGGEDRTLGEISVLVNKIRATKAKLESLGKDIYINARIDTYTTKHPDALEETLKRIQAYEEAGADGFFIPLLNDDEDIKKVLEATKLPVNVFLKDGLKSYDEFAKSGIHRTSSGNGVHAKITEKINEAFKKLNDEKSL